MDYKKILAGVVDIINTTEKSDIGFAKICTYIGENCPELKESNDERIRKELLEHCKNQAKPYVQTGNECPQIQSWIDWLEKQGKKVEPIEGFNTEFEKQISQLIASVINKEHKYNKGYVKWVSNALLNYAKHDFF